MRNIIATMLESSALLEVILEVTGSYVVPFQDGCFGLDSQHPKKAFGSE